MEREQAEHIARAVVKRLADRTGFRGVFSQLGEVALSTLHDELADGLQREGVRLPGMPEAESERDRDIRECLESPPLQADREQADRIVAVVMAELARDERLVLKEGEEGPDTMRAQLVTALLNAGPAVQAKTDAQLARDVLRSIAYGRSVHCSSAERIEAARLLLGR